MGQASGVATAGTKAAVICAVPRAGVRVRNFLADSPVVWLGGPDVTAGDGYPLEPGGPAEQVTGISPSVAAAVVPAPPGDAEPAALYGCTESGTARVAWMLAAL
jgi:hypothetical protein